jgi:Cys-tRNA(Pro)/Cys-tRNA(Cys) deacylase
MIDANVIPAVPTGSVTTAGIAPLLVLTAPDHRRVRRTGGTRCGGGRFPTGPACRGRAGLVGSGDVAGRATPATAALDAAGAAYSLHPYTADGGAAPRSSYGTEAADALGVDPRRVLKTLVAEVDGTPVLAMVPVAGTLDLKALAAARGGKRAVMAGTSAAQRLTGYVLGGIAPLGTRQPLDVVIDLSVAEHPTVYCSAGRRGLQMELSPDDLLAATGGELAELSAG